MNFIKLDPEVVAECVDALRNLHDWQECEELEVVETILKAAEKVRQHGK